MARNLSAIKLIIMDVDGTLTDGGIYIDNAGVESKKFSVKDGAGILLAQYIGIEFMVLTSRESLCVAKRAEELKIKNIHQGIMDKAKFMHSYVPSSGFTHEEIAYIGDDINDLEVMGMVGFAACPQDACNEVKNIVDLVLDPRGGDGVVRAFVELLLKDRKQWECSFNGVLRR